MKKSQGGIAEGEEFDCTKRKSIGDSVKTFLFGDDATKMKTDTVGDVGLPVAGYFCAGTRSTSTSLPSKLM